MTIEKLNNPAWHYRCRRGMLELDLLLSAFSKRLSHHLTSLDHAEQFEALLEQPDPILYAWIMGIENPPDAYLATCQAIKAHYSVSEPPD